MDDQNALSIVVMWGKRFVCKGERSQLKVSMISNTSTLEKWSGTAFVTDKYAGTRDRSGGTHSKISQATRPDADQWNATQRRSKGITRSRV
jgi:hypothetical protein